MTRGTFLTGLLTVINALLFAPLTHADIFLTINSKDVDSTLLPVDGWCTIETQSKTVDFAYKENLGDHFYAYKIIAARLTIPPSAETHFMFRYNASRLYQEFDILRSPSLVNI